MRLDEMIIILSRIKFFINYMETRTVGNQIAKSLVWSWSRATTYRKLKKMERIGILYTEEHSTGIEYFLTDKGEEFWRKYHELPLE